MQLFELFSLVSLFSAAIPLTWFVVCTRDSSLHATSVWLFVTWLIWLSNAIWHGTGGRSDTMGYGDLIAVVSVLWPIVAVLGARLPGARAWNLIVASLVIVFLLPLVEQMLLRGTLEQERVGLDKPRFVFFWLIALVGFFNYVPTRLAVCSVMGVVAITLKSLAVGPWPIEVNKANAMGCVANVIVVAMVWLPLLLARSRGESLSSQWLWFRDRWGLVWAARIRDRWNVNAAQYELPGRIEWDGITGLETSSREQCDIAQKQFDLLMKRFVVFPERDATASSKGQMSEND